MDLTGMTVAGFTELLASDAPAPGGGSAAALCGALGVALTHMVASLTADRPKYKEYADVAQDILVAAERLRSSLTGMVNEDTRAFGAYTAARALPKATDAEKSARTEAMQQALKLCTDTPLKIMEASLQALKMTRQALGKSNPSAASDLGVASLALKAAVQGAWLNILINLSGIKDEAFVAGHRDAGEKILSIALPLADNIYNEVLQSL